MLVSAFVVHKPPKTGFLALRPKRILDWTTYWGIYLAMAVLLHTAVSESQWQHKLCVCMWGEGGGCIVGLVLKVSTNALGKWNNHWILVNVTLAVQVTLYDH